MDAETIGVATRKAAALAPSHTSLETAAIDAWSPHQAFDLAYRRFILTPLPNRLTP